MKPALQRLLDTSQFLRPYGFRVVSADEEKCTLELPHRPDLERPGGIINGPALMAAADCAMWLAIKARIGLQNDALTSDLNTTFLAPAKGEPLARQLEAFLACVRTREQPLVSGAVARRALEAALRIKAEMERHAALVGKTVAAHRGQ